MISTGGVSSQFVSCHVMKVRSEVFHSNNIVLLIIVYDDDDIKIKTGQCRCAFTVSFCDDAPSSNASCPLDLFSYSGLCQFLVWDLVGD